VNAGHALVLLLLLALLASQAYVEYNYDYRDAPEDVKTALLVGFGLTALLAVLVGPKLIRARTPI